MTDQGPVVSFNFFHIFTYYFARFGRFVSRVLVHDLIVGLVLAGAIIIPFDLYSTVEMK